MLIKKLLKIFKRKHCSYLVSNLSAQDQVLLADHSFMVWTWMGGLCRILRVCRPATTRWRQNLKQLPAGCMFVFTVHTFFNLFIHYFFIRTCEFNANTWLVKKKIISNHVHKHTLCLKTFNANGNVSFISVFTVEGSRDVHTPPSLATGTSLSWKQEKKHWCVF